MCSGSRKSAGRPRSPRCSPTSWARRTRTSIARASSRRSARGWQRRPEVGRGRFSEGELLGSRRLSARLGYCRRAMGLISLRAQLEKDEVSSRELVVQALQRIDATQPTLNAFRRGRADAALAEADAADARLRAGERGPLLGIPVAIKDDIDIAGEPTAFGCEGEFEPKGDDCETVRRVKLSGAVIVGKTNTPELGQWPITEGPAFGKTRNPWNLDHTPGGSSGGSAAAVAGGVVPVALGSDGLGSVRVPAAWTNLVGIKPQRGRISTWPDAETFNGLAVIGPLARTVADAAALLDAAGGPAAGDRRPPP